VVPVSTPGTMTENKNKTLHSGSALHIRDKWRSSRDQTHWCKRRGGGGAHGAKSPRKQEKHDFVVAVEVGFGHSGAGCTRHAKALRLRCRGLRLTWFFRKCNKALFWLPGNPRSYPLWFTRNIIEDTPCIFKMADTGSVGKISVPLNSPLATSALIKDPHF